MLYIPAMLLDSGEAVYQFVLQNGRVVFITEDNDPMFENLPNRLTATILLPPYEVSALELDGNLLDAQMYYEQYLTRTPECMEFIYLIAQALMMGTPVGLHFGQQLREMHYPMWLTSFIAKLVGIQFGYGLQPGTLDERFIPDNLGVFLGRGTISVEQFFAMMPVGMDLAPNAIIALHNILRPLAKIGAPMDELNEYFKNLNAEIHNAGKYLYYPVVAR